MYLKQTEGLAMDKNSEHLIVMHQNIENKNFANANFQRSNIQNVHIQNCHFDNCDFSRSSLTNLRLTNCTFSRCIFLNVDLCFCKFSQSVFENCDFSLAEIENINFYEGKMLCVQFTGARLANNNFTETSFTNIDLNGSTTKFNHFENSIWTNSVFGNCTIDYNIALHCKFIDTLMNIETLGSIWGIQEDDLKNITFLSLGREIEEDRSEIYLHYKQYLLKKKLCLELFTFQVSLQRKNIFDCFDQLLISLKDRYTNEQYLSPDELYYFYDILKTMRKESILPMLILKEILSYFKKLITDFDEIDNYYEKILLFYNNICLIYNSMIRELSAYKYNFCEYNYEYEVKMTFFQKPDQDIVQAFTLLYQYVYDTDSVPQIQFVKDGTGSYIIWLVMPLAALAAFNIGTLLLTGGVKHLIKLRASTEILFSKKLPRKYYLEVYEKDDSEELAKGIVASLLTGKLSSLSSELRNLSSKGVNAQNIKDISADKKNSASS
jgi:uncharacterized protein YjbI with pentapeptide repeats